MASLYPHLSASDVTGGYFKRFPFHIPSQTDDWFLIWLHIRAFMYFIAYNEGIGIPFCALIPFSQCSTNIPEGTASTFDFNIPFSHLTSDKNKKAQSNSSQMESSALCLGNWLFFYEFILLLKWILPHHGAFRKFFLCFL